MTLQLQNTVKMVTKQSVQSHAQYKILFSIITKLIMKHLYEYRSEQSMHTVQVLCNRYII